jgi:hypothetical protein
MRDLITPDTNNPAARDWRNGEPDEVEIEWQLLQTDYKSSSGYNPTNGVGGANGQLAGAGQSVNNGDDVVTRRYEYYAYIGPYDDFSDTPTHEALAQTVATDGIHGVGIITNNGVVIDLSTNPIVGQFLGAQMSAMVAAPPIGLIDHLPDGEAGVAYPTRSLVIASDTNFTATLSGSLPAGMYFDAASSQVYGTPSVSGVFIVSVSATASNNPVLKKNYPFLVAADANPPAHSIVDTSAAPAVGGTTAGDGVYTNGTTATVTATPTTGYGFANWTENAVVISTAASYTFTNIINQSLVANFVPQLTIRRAGSAVLLSWTTNAASFRLQELATLGTTNWQSATNGVSIVGAQKQVSVSPATGNRFYRLISP